MGAFILVGDDTTYDYLYTNIWLKSVLFKKYILKKKINHLLFLLFVILDTFIVNWVGDGGADVNYISDSKSPLVQDEKIRKPKRTIPLAPPQLSRNTHYIFF